jgi:hypothetical protein
MPTIPDVVTALVNDQVPVKFAKKMCACFVLSSPKKFEFGILVHDIGFGAAEHKGTFLMEDKRYETFALGTLAVASNRLTLGRGENEYKSKFRAMKYRARLELYLTDAESMPGELQKGVAAAEAAFGVLPSKLVASKTNPKMTKVKYPLKKTRVASMTGEVRATCLKRSGSGWCQGVLKQYNPGQKLPYVIEWDVEPKVLENVDEQDMDVLTHYYRECDKRRLLDMECVGMELFWLRSPVTPAPRGGRLVCATIMYYDEVLEKYKLLYRDATDEWVVPKRIDDELEFADKLTLEEKRIPIQEPWHPKTQLKIQSYGMFCARNVGPPPTEKRPLSHNILSTVVLTNLPTQVPPPARTTDNNMNTTTNVVLKPTPSGSTSDTTGKETAATHGDIECSRDSQLDNDDDMKTPSTIHLGTDSKGRICNCYSSNCQIIGHRYTANMTGPDPTLIKALPPAGSAGQQSTSTTFEEVLNHGESKLDSSIQQSKTESIVDSPRITPTEPVHNLSYITLGIYRFEFLTRLFNLMYRF